MGCPRKKKPQDVGSWMNEMLVFNRVGIGVAWPVFLLVLNCCWEIVSYVFKLLCERTYIN